MNRPWMPGPWRIDDIAVGVRLCVNVTNNRLLASKSPEMVELLIELAELDGAWDEIGCYRPLCDKATKLLKEVGYEPNQD